MAKEFKEWEKRFTAEEIRRERINWLSRIPMNLPIHGWSLPLAQWSVDQIREAVYESSDVEKWQRLRIALKGTTTQQKLYVLMEYRFDADSLYREDYWIVSCRVDNYINALKRGGQLNAKLEIVK
jgi:hypothetical protein